MNNDKKTQSHIEGLKDNQVEIRRESAFFLGLQKDPKAIPALKEALQDNDEIVRENAQEALDKITGTKRLDKINVAEWAILGGVVLISFIAYIRGGNAEANLIYIYALSILIVGGIGWLGAKEKGMWIAVILWGILNSLFPHLLEIMLLFVLYTLHCC